MRLVLTQLVECDPRGKIARAAAGLSLSSLQRMRYVFAIPKWEHQNKTHKKCARGSFLAAAAAAAIIHQTDNKQHEGGGGWHNVSTMLKCVCDTEGKK